MKINNDEHVSNKELASILRNDFGSFMEKSFYELNPNTTYRPNWHIDIIAAALEECRTGKLTRLIINVPRDR